MADNEEEEIIHTVEIGKAYAEMEQTRSSALDLLRESETFHLCALNKDRDSFKLHAFCIHENEITPFYAKVAVMSIEGLAKILDTDMITAIDFVKDLIESGWKGPQSDE